MGTSNPLQTEHLSLRGLGRLISTLRTWLLYQQGHANVLKARLNLANQSTHPGLQPAGVSTGAQASEDTQMGLSRAGAPGEQPPEVRVRLHDTALDSPHTRQVHGEHWTKDGLSRTRHRQLERYDYFVPVTEPGGPDVHLLEDTRFTLLHHQDGTTSERLGNWRGRYETPPTPNKPWTGATTFTEKPGLQLPGYTTTEGRSARGLAAPTEPTPQEWAQ